MNFIVKSVFHNNAIQQSIYMIYMVAKDLHVHVKCCENILMKSGQANEEDYPACKPNDKGPLT